MKFKRKNIFYLSVFSDIALVTMILKQSKKIRNQEELIFKNDKIIKLFSQWMKLEDEKKYVGNYLKNEYRTVAIYGMGILGNRLLTELKKSGIEVLYIIDQRADAIRLDIPAFTIRDDLPNVDAVIVTTVSGFHQIEHEIKIQIDTVVLALEDIFYEMLYQDS